jgi:hypothetical protein
VILPDKEREHELADDARNDGCHHPVEHTDQNANPQIFWADNVKRGREIQVVDGENNQRQVKQSSRQGWSVPLIVEEERSERRLVWRSDKVAIELFVHLVGKENVLARN